MNLHRPHRTGGDTEFAADAGIPVKTYLPGPGIPGESIGGAYGDTGPALDAAILIPGYILAERLHGYFQTLQIFNCFLIIIILPL